MSEYSDTLIDHLTVPRNQTVLDSNDVVGVCGTPGQGAYVVVYLKVTDELITDISFQSHGCGPTIACSSMLTTLVKRKSTEDAATLSVEDLIEAVGGLPPHKLHCAHRAINALHDALDGLRNNDSVGDNQPS